MENYWIYALKEIAFVSVVLGVPILMAWAWKKYQDYKAHRNMVRYVTYNDMGHPQVLHDYKQAMNDLRTRRQKRRDDHIFNTVEEYRNDCS